MSTSVRALRAQEWERRTSLAPMAARRPAPPAACSESRPLSSITLKKDLYALRAQVD